MRFLVALPILLPLLGAAVSIGVGRSRTAQRAQSRGTTTRENCLQRAMDWLVMVFRRAIIALGARPRPG